MKSHQEHFKFTEHFHSRKKKVLANDSIKLITITNLKTTYV